MNKKILTICLLTALILVLTCFASCDNGADTADKLREINVALMQEYSKIELKVQTHTDETDLNAKYVMTKSGAITDISYEVERLNSFGADGKIPSDYISIVTGTAKFDGTSVTYIDGEPLQESVILGVAKVNMAFRLSYFTDIKTGQHGLSAKVTDPQSFLQNEEFTGDNMTVKVVMTQTSLSNIIISYEVNSATVLLEYTFTV